MQGQNENLETEAKLSRTLFQKVLWDKKARTKWALGPLKKQDYRTKSDAELEEAVGTSRSKLLFGLI